ncbi:MAG: AbrB/MazE/SpoVT family DNA-binding domain-containing protein [Betaproteobacteria bacterium]|nr:MAG: AbrB/MazE/SpoVT family DNA-binding domain-containing protein [Betaproteobacteria bacterium]
MDATTVTSKGQVTIPKEVRRRFGIRQGSRVEFAIVGNRIEMRLASRPLETGKSGYGMLRSRRRAAPADLDPASLIKR